MGLGFGEQAVQVMASSMTTSGEVEYFFMIPV